MGPIDSDWLSSPLIPGNLKQPDSGNLSIEGQHGHCRGHLFPLTI